MWLRAMRDVLLQAGKAALAAATAASTSAAPPRGTRAISAPVAGSKTGPVASRGTSTEQPSIQWERTGSSSTRAFRLSSCSRVVNLYRLSGSVHKQDRSTHLCEPESNRQSGRDSGAACSLPNIALPDKPDRGAGPTPAVDSVGAVDHAAVGCDRWATARAVGRADAARR